MAARRKKHNPVIVAGIDVGGRAKGFHVVVLRNRAFHAKFHSTEVREVVCWCKCHRVQVIGIDAPSRWRNGNMARCAELQLNDMNVSCFFTPTKAHASRSTFYRWMKNGMSLYKAFQKTHPLGTAFPLPLRQKQCFETFPHAVTCALKKRVVSAAKNAQKKKMRGQLLIKNTIRISRPTSIDFLDAGLCALTAYLAATHKPCDNFGVKSTGWIIVPAGLK